MYNLLSSHSYPLLFHSLFYNTWLYFKSQDLILAPDWYHRHDHWYLYYIHSNPQPQNSKDAPNISNCNSIYFPSGAISKKCVLGNSSLGINICYSIKGFQSQRRLMKRVSKSKKVDEFQWKNLKQFSFLQIFLKSLICKCTLWISEWDIWYAVFPKFIWPWNFFPWNFLEGNSSVKHILS